MTTEIDWHWRIFLIVRACGHACKRTCVSLSIYVHVMIFLIILAKQIPIVNNMSMTSPINSEIIIKKLLEARICQIELFEESPDARLQRPVSKNRNIFSSRRRRKTVAASNMKRQTCRGKKMRRTANKNIKVLGRD